MKQSDITSRLLQTGCRAATSASATHELWTCPCGAHQVPVPTQVQQLSPGVAAHIVHELACLPSGWSR